MTPYIRNRNCRCVRCQASGLMGAAVLITLGVLFLLDSNHVIRFDQGLPVLLLVIGGVLMIARVGSTEGHVQPGWIQGPTAPPPAQQPWTPAAVPPPPPQPEQWNSGADNPPSSPDQNDSQVKP
jgi:hypothetical protein